MPTPVYLDNHSTTRVDPRVVDVMLPYFSDDYGNAASVNHAFGWKAADAIAHAREQVARLVHAVPEAIVFTSGATEANNLAIKGVMAAAKMRPHLVVNAAEHRAVLDPAKRLKRAGIDVTVVPVDAYGRVDPDKIEAALRDNTALVSVMWANNEVGTINDIAEVGRVCREKGVLFHTDAAQATGRVPVELKNLPVDLLSFSAHKLYGPKGIGALYVRRGEPRVRVDPLIDGGGHERRLRSGTLPVPLVVGFGAACNLASQEIGSEAKRIGALRDSLWASLQNELGGVTRNGDPQNCLPGNLNVSFEGVDGDALMTNLKAVAVSSGSACTTADPEPSHVLRAMGVDETLTRASLRFGLGRFNTSGDIEVAIDEVVRVARHLRKSTDIK